MPLISFKPGYNPLKYGFGENPVLLYYTLAGLLLLITGPILLLTAKRRVGLGQKLGIIPPDIAAKLSAVSAGDLDNCGRDARAPAVWFHAVSVGEFNAAWPLIQAFKQKHPNIPLVISTATATGQQLAKQRASDIATIIYFPLDLPLPLANWLDAVKPQLAVIVETELWPGFTHECQKRNVPIAVVNGRISLRSFARYLCLKPMFAPILRRLSLIVAQNQSELARYQAIGGKQLPIAAFGNLKFDGMRLPEQGQLNDLRRSLNIEQDDLVIVAGSTHEGEESALLECLAHFKSSGLTSGQSGQKLPTPKLILAPRHPERWARVANLIESAGYRVRSHSRQEIFDNDNDVYLLDTIGQLFTHYGLATAAFVGGTLVPVGGHNLVEPMAYAVPVVCGPQLFKTADVAQSLIDHNALTVVNDGIQLQQELKLLLESEQLRQQRGRAGQIWLAASQGAVDKTLQALESLLAASYNKVEKQAAPGVTIR